jgi:hypothetical protein
MNLGDADLQDIVNDPEKVLNEIKIIPCACHTQAVERGVKMITRVSKSSMWTGKKR